MAPKRVQNVLELFPWVTGWTMLREEVRRIRMIHKSKQIGIDCWSRNVGLNDLPESYAVIARKVGLTESAAQGCGTRGLQFLRSAVAWGDSVNLTPFRDARPLEEKDRGTVSELFFEIGEGRQGYIDFHDVAGNKAKFLFKSCDCVTITPYQDLKIGSQVSFVVRGDTAQVVELRSERELGRAKN